MSAECDVCSEHTLDCKSEFFDDFYSMLSERDQELFLKILANPPPLSETFIKAYLKFHNSKKESDNGK